MTDDALSKVLVLGGAGTGKTTFLVQLYGRIKVGRGRLRARGAPESLAPIEAGLKRLQQGVAVMHTAQGTDVTLSLPATTRDEVAVDIVIPDYAGEDLGLVIAGRAIPERWRVAATADRWLLLIRLSQHPELPDVLSRPIGELANRPSEPAAASEALPVDMWAVELLQALLYWRHHDRCVTAPHPRLTLVLSCWDELGATQGETPETIARQRLALLDTFCRSTWPASLFDVAGLSAQGHALDDDQPSEDYLDHGPQEMGWIMAGEGAKDVDLTALVADAPV